MLSLDQYTDNLTRDGRLTPAVAEALAKARQLRATNRHLFYIAGALTGVAESVKARYGLASDLLERMSQPSKRMFGYVPHLHGTDPVAHPDVTPAEVRDIDHLFAVITPDCHLNFTDPVAHGNGIEEGWAEMAGIPAVYLAPTSQRLSRIVLGMHNIAHIIRYEDFAIDGLAQLTAWLGSLP